MSDNKDEGMDIWKNAAKQLSTKKYEQEVKAAYKNVDLVGFKNNIRNITKERIENINNEINNLWGNTINNNIINNNILNNRKLNDRISNISLKNFSKDNILANDILNNNILSDNKMKYAVELFNGKYLHSPTEIFNHYEMESSFVNEPLFDKIELNYISSNMKKVNTPDWFPKKSLCKLNDPAIYTKFDLDTLFFIFYFFKGTVQQTLAAIQLKKEAWRFHLKYKMWFQRLDEPKLITLDYEKGEFLFFDYETTWNFMKKNDFVFEYCYLECNEHY